MVGYGSHESELVVQVDPALLLSYYGEIKNESEWIKIILITKQESVELQKLGHKFGNEGTLHHTYTSHKRYYLTESKQALADLDKIRKSHITEK